MREKKLIQANTVDCRKTSKKNARHYSRDYLVLGNGNSKGKALPWYKEERNNSYRKKSGDLCICPTLLFVHSDLIVFSSYLSLPFTKLFKDTIA